MSIVEEQNLTLVVQKLVMEIEILQNEVREFKEKSSTKEWMNQKETASYLNICEARFISLTKKLRERGIELPGFLNSEKGSRREYRYNKTELDIVVLKFGSLEGYAQDRMDNVA